MELPVRNSEFDGLFIEGDSATAFTFITCRDGPMWS